MNCKECKWFEPEDYVSYFSGEEVDKMIAEEIPIEERQKQCEAECYYGFCHSLFTLLSYLFIIFIQYCLY